MSENFSGKVIIITGSSMGIGKSLASLLGEGHAKLVINARNQEILLATEKELKGLGYEVISFAGDITSEIVCKNLVDTTVRHYGRIDVLVNNAGVSMRGTIDQLMPDVISTIFNVNTIAPVILTKMALPYIKLTKGSIIFISSLAGLRGLPFISIYSAAKMALTAVAEALRVENKLNGIHIGLVYVGYTAIESGKTAINYDGNPILLAERKGYLNDSTERVAKEIARNIAGRKKKTIIGVPGKLYAFLVRYLPGILELMVLRSHRKMEKFYQ